jgi:hypothetical protein
MAQRTIVFALAWLSQQYGEGAWRGDHDTTQSVLAIQEELDRLRRIEAAARELANSGSDWANGSGFNDLRDALDGA